MSEPKLEASKFCDAFRTWAKACSTPLDTDDERMAEWREEFEEHWRFIELAIEKSCLLDRLIYSGEPIRATACPKHKGHWSGYQLPVGKSIQEIQALIDGGWKACDCAHGAWEITGWLP